MDAEGENEEEVKSKHRSKVWEYFEVISRKDWLAKCKECNKTLSYRSSISNLKKHLFRKHEDTMEKMSDDSGEMETVEEITFLEDVEDGIAMASSEEQENEITFDKRKILRNGAWEYFEVLDEERKMATCTICREQFSYRTTSTNLARHLKRRHCIEFEKVTEDEEYTIEQDVDGEDNDAEVDDEDSDDRNLSSTDKRRARTSAAWEFFTIKDHERRVATCKLCDSEFSYLTSVSNLMKHVKTRHSVKANSAEDCLQYDDENDSKQDPRNRSSVWLYFKCIDPVAKVSVCLICKKQLSHLTSITNLKKHLFRKHPRAQLHPAPDNKKMLIASDGQLYEIEEASPKLERPDVDDEHDQKQPPELSAIYLEECGSPRAKRRRARSPSSDEEITFHKKYVRKKLDSLDQFGRYLVSLLKQLPPATAGRLQAEFVKMATSAQLPEELPAHDNT